MNVISTRPGTLLALAALAVSAPASLSAQQQDQDQDQSTSNDQVVVEGTPPTDLSGLTAGPEIKGIISARSANGIQVTGDDGASSTIAISDATRIKATGGFLGTDSDKLAANSLLNGLPVTVKTLQWNNGLLASRIDLKSKDLKTASMIRNGTSQRFAEQGAAIDKNGVAIGKNIAATEALRGRLGDIDKYDIKGTTNVYFDTGKWDLSAKARNDLCSAATQAQAMDNALLLVVGYTDSVGSQDYNQTLSEKRAGRVVNYLQQQCGWKPWRMLTPTGMAEADPLASNDTAAGKAQNRRVSVNILISKSVEE